MDDPIYKQEDLLNTTWAEVQIVQEIDMNGTLVEEI